MDRKEFLKKAGVGSAALASLPALAGAAWADGEDDDDGRRLRFYLVALSGVAPAITAGDSLLMAGCGSFMEGNVRGGGDFNHFDGTNFGTPDNLVATGKWRATQFLSFEEVGTWGVGVSGVLRVEIQLRPCEGEVISGATLEIVCNLAPAGITTGGVEGFTLDIPGVATFRQFVPNIGLTLFTRRCREVHED
jgi:hypothetical protein